MAGSDCRVRCFFARGGFAHERAFWIPAPGGEGYYTGTAYIAYCFAESGEPLPNDEPRPGETVPGAMSARIVVERDDAGRVLVAVPDGGVCSIDPSILTRASQRNVPV